MDHGIGRIVDKLEALGITNDTLVFFTSDNGFNVGHHGLLGKGNGTFPINMYEESVKVPFIARCPGKIPGDRVNRSLVSHYDFLPTLLDYLDMPNPIEDELPGRSFAAVLRGADGGDEAVFVCDEYGPVRMVREREWKYVHRYPYGPHELYNLAADPGETHNLLEEEAYAETLERLRGKLESWFLQYVNPLRDGVRQQVTGKGQIDLVGPDNQGREAFSDDPRRKAFITVKKQEE